jgi:hypothetical protein
MCKNQVLEDMITQLDYFIHDGYLSKGKQLDILKYKI